MLNNLFYDLVFLSHIPVFYKVNLYNEIARRKMILVIFIANDTIEKRSSDFLTLNDAQFEYVVLNDLEFENRNQFISLKKLFSILMKINFSQIVISGWDLIEFWMALIFINKKKNALALESTIYESPTRGIKGAIKKIFLSRISKVYASGNLHKALLEKLNYKGIIIITKGVGLIRKPKKIYVRNSKSKSNIVYIGRLSIEKNLNSIIKVVNEFPGIKFNIYGIGPEENNLKLIAEKNVFFHGSVANNSLEEIFVNADFLVLPSLSETWGLVIEEALYFNLPVIVSDRCGASEIVSKDFVFNIDSFQYQFYSFLKNYQIIESFENMDQIILEKDLIQISVY